MQRLATAAVLAPILWASIKLAPPFVFSTLVILVIVAASWECYGMLRHRGGRPFAWVGIAAAAAVAGSFMLQTAPLHPGHALIAAVVAVVLLAMYRRQTPAEMLDTVLITLFPLLFVALTLGYVIALREMPGADGSDLVLLLFICVIFGDTAAFYVGKRFGRHKLAPTISPAKTREGAGGAVAGSVIGACVGHVWFYQSLPLAHAIVVGLLLGVAGMLGDLAESMVKRACGVKDSSKLLPGHGGVLDRTDNLLLAAPLLYYYYVFVLRGAL